MRFSLRNSFPKNLRMHTAHWFNSTTTARPLHGKYTSGLSQKSFIGGLVSETNPSSEASRQFTATKHQTLATIYEKNKTRASDQRIYLKGIDDGIDEYQHCQHRRRCGIFARRQYRRKIQSQTSQKRDSVVETQKQITIDPSNRPRLPSLASHVHSCQQRIINHPPPPGCSGHAPPGPADFRIQRGGQQFGRVVAGTGRADAGRVQQLHLDGRARLHPCAPPPGRIGTRHAPRSVPVFADRLAQTWVGAHLGDPQLRCSSCCGLRAPEQWTAEDSANRRQLVREEMFLYALPKRCEGGRG